MTAALKGESNHAKSMKFHQPEDTTKSGTRPSRHRSRRRDLARFARLGIGPELLIEVRVCRVTDSEARTHYGITGAGDMAGSRPRASAVAAGRFQRRAAAALGAPTQDPLRETRNPGRSFPNIIRSVPQHRESPYAPNLLNLQE